MAPPAPTVMPYTGNGPYCYTNSLISVLGPDAPSAAVVETLTGSPFGFQLLAGELPLFDPYGWNPNLGLDQALGLLGYTWQSHTAKSAPEALAALKRALQAGPVFIGPLDMGLLLHQPGSDRPSGADHYVVALAVEGGAVIMHDPQGHPWASLPAGAFCAAWQADRIGYGQPYAMRTDFVRVREVDPLDAVRASLPLAAAWARGRGLPVPPGTLGGRAGLERLAERAERQLDPGLQQMLSGFSLRLGARRRADAAQNLQAAGEVELALRLQDQARVLGALQYPAVTGDGQALGAGFRQLADLSEQVATSLTARV